MEKIKVLIVDDSALVRQTLSEILSGDANIEVAATAQNPFIAAEKLRKQTPDVIVLDIEMPRMDGLTFLRKLMSQCPIPVVMCSSMTGEGCEATFKALEYGAVDAIEKPKIGTKKFLEEATVRIRDAVKAAAKAKIKKIVPTVNKQVQPKLTADAVLAKTRPVKLAGRTEKIVVVGASTGGTEALRTFLEAFPEDAPGIVIVQHMPEKFTAAFANRLDGICRISVKEAANGDAVLRGRALIAPGNHHLLLKRNGTKYYVETREGPLVSRHRPSVDVLFRAAAQSAGKNAIAVIMTGMGDDGARGMEELKEAGAFTIAQDEASCIVFGMPNEAIKRNAVDKIITLERIAAEVLQACGHPAAI